MSVDGLRTRPRRRPPTWVVVACGMLAAAGLLFSATFIRDRREAVAVWSACLERAAAKLDVGDEEGFQLAASWCVKASGASPATRARNAS